MAPTLEKRLLYGYYGGDNDSDWWQWGRWVLLAVIIAVAIICFLFFEGVSCRRVRRGQRPITGTGWLIPPSYYESQQQHQQQNAHVPTYKAEPGTGDAGHFDQNGNFVPYTGPQYQLDEYNPPAGGNNDYPPPSMPPPSHQAPANVEEAGPPPGPPPSHADYYPPNGMPSAPRPAKN